VKALLKTCFSGLKSSRWVGDFQVATGGGFWVATRDQSTGSEHTQDNHTRSGFMRKMNAKQGKKLYKGKVPNGLPNLNVDAAGIDVGLEEHWVAVPEDRAERPVRCFKYFTADLQAMV
jgi:hypothetical protein